MTRFREERKPFGGTLNASPPYIRKPPPANPHPGTKKSIQPGTGWMRRCLRRRQPSRWQGSGLPNRRQPEALETAAIPVAVGDAEPDRTEVAHADAAPVGNH